MRLILCQAMYCHGSNVANVKQNRISLYPQMCENK